MNRINRMVVGESKSVSHSRILSALFILSRNLAASPRPSGLTSSSKNQRFVEECAQSWRPDWMYSNARAKSALNVAAETPKEKQTQGSESRRSGVRRCLEHRRTPDTPPLRGG
jgi:hypothetical protein